MGYPDSHVLNDTVNRGKWWLSHPIFREAYIWYVYVGCDGAFRGLRFTCWQHLYTKAILWQLNRRLKKEQRPMVDTLQDFIKAGWCTYPHHSSQRSTCIKLPCPSWFTHFPLWVHMDSQYCMLNSPHLWWLTQHYHATLLFSRFINHDDTWGYWEIHRRSSMNSTPFHG